MRLRRAYPSAEEVLAMLGNSGLLSDYMASNVGELVRLVAESEFYAIEGGRRGVIGVLWLVVRPGERARVCMILDRRFRGLLKQRPVKCRCDESAHGLGKMMAFEALKGRVFGVLDCERLETAIPADRRAAIRLASCLGFKWEGIHKRYYKVNGRPIDVAVMAITRETE